MGNFQNQNQDDENSQQAQQKKLLQQAIQGMSTGAPGGQSGPAFSDGPPNSFSGGPVNQSPQQSLGPINSMSQPANNQTNTSDWASGSLNSQNQQPSNGPSKFSQPNQPSTSMPSNSNSNLGGGWDQFHQPGSHQNALKDAFGQGLSGEDAVQFAAKNGAPGIAYYADKNQYGLPNGYYVAPNPQDGSKMDLIQRAPGGEHGQSPMFNPGAITQRSGAMGGGLQSGGMMGQMPQNGGMNFGGGGGLDMFMQRGNTGFNGGNGAIGAASQFASQQGPQLPPTGAPQGQFNPQQMNGGANPLSSLPPSLLQYLWQNSQQNGGNQQIPQG